MTRISRRSMLRATALTAAVAALSACGPSTKAGQEQTSGAAGVPGTPGTTTIQHWDWWVTQGPTIDNEIKLFEAKNPSIKVVKTTQVTDQYPNLLQLAVKANTAPDVLLIPSTPDLVEQIGQNWLKPLNEWATDKWQAGFPSDSFAEGSNVFGGKVYSAPYDGPAPWLQLYLNNTVFKNAGLVDANGKARVPQNWDDVRGMAQTITKAGSGNFFGWGFGDKQQFVLPWQLMMCQRSGTPDAQTSFDLRTGHYTWASNPVFADWIKFFTGMKSDGSIISQAMSIDDEQARVQFATGKFGMLIGGVWVQSGWQQTNPDFSDYTVAALPYNGSKPTSFFYRTPGGVGFGLSGETKLGDAAWSWFEWLNSPDAAIRWVQAGQGLRVFPQANKPDYAKTEPYREYMNVALNGTRLAPAPSLVHPTMSQVKPQSTLPDIQGILEGIYTGQIADAKSALQDLQSRQDAAQAAAIKDAQSRSVKVDPAWWTVTDWNLTEDYPTKS